MNNEQIIYEIAVGLFGEEVTEKMLEDYGEIPLHTLQGWKLRGFKVKKGEKGLESRLWKKKNRKKEQESGDSSIQEDADNTANRDFYLCKSYLFRADQVEVYRK